MATAGDPGAAMAADIAEQPEVFARMLDGGLADIEAAAAAVVARSPRHVVLLGRGTSDHAALYGAYLAEIELELPAGLASPSAVTAYGARPDYANALVIAVSQSGGSPDLIEVLQVARHRGALTLAVTNAAASALVEAADVAVDIRAAEERAVAATKTYTAELLALLMLVLAVRGGGRLPSPVRHELASLPPLAAELLSNRAATELAPRYRFATSLLTTGRGYGYPTAREAALKLMETSHLAALAFSGADLLHGPVTLADPQVPVLAVVGGGPGGAAMRPALSELGRRRADIVVFGPSDVEFSTFWVPTPAVAERYAPLLDILPLQQLAMALALARGENPDAPRGLAKVTYTR